MSASRNVDSLFAHGTAIEQSALYAALRYSCDLTICAAGTISPSRAIRSEKRETRFGIVIVEKTVGDSSTRAVRRRKRARCTHISKYRTRDRRKDRSRRRDRLSGWNIAPCRDIDRGRRNKIMLKLIDDDDDDDGGDSATRTRRRSARARYLNWHSGIPAHIFNAFSYAPRARGAPLPLPLPPRLFHLRKSRLCKFHRRCASPFI